MRHASRFLGLFKYSAACLGVTISSVVFADQGPSLSKEQLEFIKQHERVAAENYQAKRIEERHKTIQRLLRDIDTDDYPTQSTAIEQLTYMELSESKGLPLFSNLLAHKADIVKAGAIRGLAKYGLAAVDNTNKIFKILEDKEMPGYVKEEAAIALGEIAVKDEVSSERLIKNLSDREIPVSAKVGVLKTLEEYGALASKATPLMIEFLEGRGSDSLQLAAFNALGKISAMGITGEQESDRDLINSSHAFTGRSPHEISIMFHNIKNNKEALSENLLEALLKVASNDDRNYIRAAAIETLAELHVYNADVVFAFVDNISHDSGTIGGAALKALKKITSEDVQALPVLSEALLHRDSLTRIESARILQIFGPKAIVALDNLVSVLLQRSNGKTDFYEVGEYLDTIRTMKNAAERAASHLIGLHNSSRLFSGRKSTHKSMMKGYIWVVLADIGVPKKSLKLINQALKQDEPHIYAGAARAAGSLGPIAKSSIPHLIRALNPNFPEVYVGLNSFGGTIAPDTSMRLEAIRALGKIGPDAKEAVPLLKSLLEGPRLSTLFSYEEVIGVAIREIQAHSVKQH